MTGTTLSALAVGVTQAQFWIGDWHHPLGHASEIDLVRVRRVVAGLAEALDDPERPRELEAIIGRALATRPSNRKSR